MSEPLIVIVGETASGKSALAIALAERFDGEIICADSRTVYTGMDIGTAKPTQDERHRVKHWGLDLVSPDQRYTAAAFKNYASNVIYDIHKRKKVPILVGGTGLYIDAVLYDYKFRPPADPEQRRILERLSTAQLQKKLIEQGIPLPGNKQNPRHLIRTLETGGQTAGRSELRPDTLILGIKVDREVLRQRVSDRVDAMVTNRFVEEIQKLSIRYGWDVPAMLAPGYRAFRGYIEGSKTLEQAKADFVHNDLDLAKRQRTWFRRNKSIHWLSADDKLTEAIDISTTFLNKKL